jgi:hypothetical protein
MIAAETRSPDYGCTALGCEAGAGINPTRRYSKDAALPQEIGSIAGTMRISRRELPDLHQLSLQSKFTKFAAGRLINFFS